MMTLDFVSDVVCPWCAIGLAGLERALERLDGTLQWTLRFHPFELNPSMGAQGEDLVAHLTHKYGITPAQVAHNQAAIRERGAAVGFAFGERTRIWNTFDAHRLLHWAGLQGRQLQLKRALLAAYHGRGENPSAPDVLAAAAVEAGLDAEAARAVIGSEAYGDEVREQERRIHEMGLHAVPALIIDGRHLIQGGQPPEVIEDALRRIAAGA